MSHPRPIPGTPNMPTPRRHAERYPVLPEDIDDLGHVNNLVYLRWVQQVATAHWRDAARPEDRAATVWVVVRHEIDFVKPAVEGDEVEAVTWVERWRGATSDRHTELRRRADGELLARARTVWCALDRASGKPRRVPDALTHPFLEDE